MNKKTWPTVLMVCGFGLAAICLAIILFTTHSASVNVVASIGQSLGLGIGIGSVGLGGYITRLNRKQ